MAAENLHAPLHPVNVGPYNGVKTPVQIPDCDCDPEKELLACGLCSCRCDCWEYADV